MNADEKKVMKERVMEVRKTWEPLLVVAARLVGHLPQKHRYELATDLHR
jgi:hypothetical protein